MGLAAQRTSPVRRTGTSCGSGRRSPLRGEDDEDSLPLAATDLRSIGCSWPASGMPGRATPRRARRVAGGHRMGRADLAPVAGRGGSSRRPASRPRGWTNGRFAA